MQPRGYQLSTINQRLTRPSSRLHPRMLSGIGSGKSYPVTAAQLLPICTGFLAPIHFSLTRKEPRSRTSGLRSRTQDLFILCCHVERQSRHLLLLTVRDFSTSLGMTKNSAHPEIEFQL